MTTDNKIRRLQVFDFDGTLANTASPEEGKPAWEKHYGKPFPHLGWWGRPESLDLGVFNIKMFPSLLNQLKREVSTPDTYVIILTSRLEKLRPQLKAVLDANGVHVNAIDMKHNELTKGEKILRYIDHLFDLEEVSVYDDREVDIASYQAVRERIPEGITFNIYLADNGKFGLVENKLLKIIKEEIENFSDIKTLNSVMDIYHGSDVDNIKQFMRHPQILPPDAKTKLPSNTGGFNIGLSTSTDKDKAMKYSMGLRNNKVLHMQLLSGSKIIEIDTGGRGIDNVLTGDELENYQNHGIDAIVELDDDAESEVRVLSTAHLKVIRLV